jgi:hypothetical protein
VKKFLVKESSTLRSKNVEPKHDSKENRNTRDACQENDHGRTVQGTGVEYLAVNPARVPWNN